MPFDAVQRQRVQHRVHQRGCSGQRLCQRIEGRLAARQRFAVAHEFKAPVDRIAHYIGQVVEVERGQVARAVVLAHGTESPGQRVCGLGVAIHIERGEARALWQKTAPGDAVAERGVAPLQKSDDRGDGGSVAVKVRDKALHAGAALADRKFQRGRTDTRQAVRREQGQDQCQCQVFLYGIHVPPPQEPGDVRRGGVGGVELRHRRDHAQHPQPADCGVHAWFGSQRHMPA